MALFTKHQHADNPPSSWAVVKSGTVWNLVTKNGEVIEYGITTKAKAESLRTSGHLVELYNKEGRWYAGEDIPGWRPFRERGGFVRA